MDDDAFPPLPTRSLPLKGHKQPSGVKKATPVATASFTTPRPRQTTAPFVRSQAPVQRLPFCTSSYSKALEPGATKGIKTEARVSNLKDETPTPVVPARTLDDRGRVTYLVDIPPYRRREESERIAGAFPDSNRAVPGGAPQPLPERRELHPAATVVVLAVFAASLLPSLAYPCPFCLILLVYE